MKKSEGNKLAKAIKDLGLKKSHFALLIDRTPVCVSGYIHDRMAIPEWVWIVIKDAKSLSEIALKKKIDGLRTAKENA